MIPSLSSPEAVRDWLRAQAGDPLFDGLRVTDTGAVAGRFLRCEVTTAAQPVVGADHRRAVATHALARIHAPSGGLLAPWNLFALAARADELVQLDRRCRMVHVLNHFTAPGPARPLLLNVHARLIDAVAADHGRVFRAALAALSISPARITIVLPPLAAADVDRQAQAIAAYRRHGFAVGLCADSPATALALLARVPVDLARIDARRITDPGWLASVEAMRRRGIAVLAARIEREAQRQQAIAAGAALLQGWLIGEPQLNSSLRADAGLAATGAALRRALAA